MKALRKRGLALASAVIGLASSHAVAAASCDTAEQCLAVLESSQRSIKALSARFEQTKHLSLLNEPLVTRGQFAFRAPDRVLWRVDDPPITVRIDREGLHLPDAVGMKEEVAALAPFSAMMRQLSGIFTGSLSTVRNTFDVTASGDDRMIRVRLVPRDPQWRRTFQSITMSFAAPDWVVSTMHLEESLGDSLDIIFSDVHRNDAVANAAFDAP